MNVPAATQGRQPATRRGRERREQILNAAAEIFAERGFHAAGVIEIGAAAGVTGAALYRHFTNKDDLLVALLDRAVDQLLQGARDAVGLGAEPASTLSTLVAAHVDFALRDRAVLVVYAQEAHNLPEADRGRLRRNQRQYVEIWREVLTEVHPALAGPRSLARVEAVFGLLNSAPNLSDSVADSYLRDELRLMAEAALHAIA